MEYHEGVRRWPYGSHAELVRAGYLYRCPVECKRCAASILIYSKPQGGAIALEHHSFHPHRWRCPPKARTQPVEQADLFAA